jgi:hypothetical protein
LLLSSTLKKEVAVLTLSLDKFKTNWEGVIRPLTEDKFARVFQKWLECCASGFVLAVDTSRTAGKYIFW